MVNTTTCNPLITQPNSLLIFKRVSLISSEFITFPMGFIISIIVIISNDSSYNVVRRLFLVTIANKIQSSQANAQVQVQGMSDVVRVINAFKTRL